MKCVAFVLLSVVLINRPTSAATFVTLPPIPGAKEGSTTAFGIDGNNVVGSYSDASGTSHGFLFNGSGYVPLDDPMGKDSFGTVANGISGQNIVGHYWDASNTGHGFLFDGSSYHTIDHPGNAMFTVLTAISGNKMVGFYQSFDEGLGTVNHGFIYDGSTFTPLDDPLAAPGGGTMAAGISGNKVVGTYFAAVPGSNFSVEHSFLFDGTNYSDLSYPGGFGISITGIDGNNIVGTLRNTDLSSFLYNDLTQTWTELDYPGAVATFASGISGNRIVGYYWIPFNGSFESFGFVATVPEPSSLILLAIGGLGVAGMAVARRARIRPCA